MLNFSMHCKKRLVTFRSPARENLVSDIPAGDGNVANLFLQCGGSRLCKLTKYVYIKSTTVYVPSSELGTNPSLASERAPPPRTGEEGAQLACG